MMKRFLLMAATVAIASPSAFAADVGVSVTVGQPGFYGRIDIGDSFPAPALVYSQPLVIRPAPVGVVAAPLYLRVPPGHAKHWDKHCGQYNACSRPVYFVQENWYNDVYVPHYREYSEHRGDDRDRYDDDHGDHGKGHHGHGKKGHKND
jgi:hypothetical protein